MTDASIAPVPPTSAVTPTEEDRAPAALARAVRLGDLETVRTLLAGDARLARLASTRGGSLALEAFERELSEIAELLFATRDGGSMVALDVHEAASLGRPAALRHALTEDMTVIDEAGPAGFLPLHRAAYRGHVEAVTLLLEAGADPNAHARNAAAPTPLASAVAGAARFVSALETPRGAEYAEVCRRLRAAGGDPRIELEGGWTPRSAAERDGLGALLGD